MQKFGVSIYVLLAKILGSRVPSSTPSLLSLTSSSRKKNKRTELDDRRLILCHAKVGGQALVSTPGEIVGPPPPPPPGFAPMVRGTTL